MRLFGAISQDERLPGRVRLFCPLALSHVSPSGVAHHGIELLRAASRSWKSRSSAHVAQSVEHLHGKEKVIGSIPIVGSILRVGRSGRAERYGVTRGESARG